MGYLRDTLPFHTLFCSTNDDSLARVLGEPFDIKKDFMRHDE